MINALTRLCLQVLSFFRRKSKLGKQVPAGFGDMPDLCVDFVHFVDFLSCTMARYRVSAISLSLLDVAPVFFWKLCNT